MVPVRPFCLALIGPPAFLALAGPGLVAGAHAATVTLQASGGGAWTGTANTCTYAGVSADAAGNLTVTCGGGATGPTPPIILNAPNRSLTLNQAMAPLSLAGYVQATDGDPITGYSYTGALPAGLSFSAATGTISGTPTVAGTSTINWTAADKDGSGTPDALQLSVAAAPADGCAPAPANYTVIDYPSYNSSSATYIESIAAGQGLALRFTIDTAAYPYGYRLTDAVGGSKNYRISRCPGATDGPVDGQNGAISVNGDSRYDNCASLSAYVRYKNTSGAAASYYANSGNLSWQTTCFLPTTTALGNATPATYYLNILNTGTSAVSIQFKNAAQLN